MTRIVVDPLPAVRCKPSSVTVTLTAQACGAPSGGSYRVRAGEKTFAWGDVPALTAGSSTDVKTTYVPVPADGQVTLTAEVGPPVPRPSTGPAAATPPMNGFGTGFGGSSGAPGAIAGGMSAPLDIGTAIGAQEGSRLMKVAAGDLFKQAEAVKGTKLPAWVEDAKIALAKKLEGMATKSITFGDRMLTICPREAGVEAKSWID